jgi:hypothetical protein
MVEWQYRPESTRGKGLRRQFQRATGRLLLFTAVPGQQLIAQWIAALVVGNLAVSGQC